MRYWGKVKSDFKGLQRLMLALDMNVICTSHQKDVYGAGFLKTGVTFDSMKGDDYLFDLVFRVERRDKDLVACKVKERAEIGKRNSRRSLYGLTRISLNITVRKLSKRGVPIVMATPEQVATITKLVEIVKVEDEVLTKWFAKADVDEWSEMSGEQITKCIEFLNKKIASLTGDQKTAAWEASKEVKDTKKKGK